MGASRWAINYGVDKVRFPAPVQVGARIRAGVEIAEVTDVAGGIQVKMRITIEVEGTEKPACVIESLARWVDCAALAPASPRLRFIAV